MAPNSVLLPGKSHGRRSLVGCSPWGWEESDTTEQLHFHFSLSCTGEGNGNPLQCSCLENPRDGGAWWAAVYTVAQSQTQLKRLSSAVLSIHYIFVGKGINNFGLHNRINKFPKKLNYVPVGKDGCMFAIPSLHPFLGAWLDCIPPNGSHDRVWLINYGENDCVYF